MNKVAIRSLILAMGVSLAGLAVFQVYWIESIISANEEGFRRDVQEALTAVVEKLEKKEVLIVTVDNFRTNFIYKSPSESDSNKVELIESTFEKKVIEIQDYVKDITKRPEWLAFYFDSEKRDNDHPNLTFKIKERIPVEENSHTIIRDGEVDSIISDNQDYQARLKRISKKSEYIQMAMHELFSGVKTLESRVDINEADSLLNASLLDRGIDLNFYFGIYDPLNDETVVHHNTGSRFLLEKSDLRASLFPNDVMGASGYLIVRFPNQQKYLLGKIWLTLVSSLIFIVVISLCFSYAIHIIFRQKKLSEIKNDFINNMTHEFKTPISTVSLACEALRDKQVSNIVGLKERYLAIINDENKRLGLQVEKVLQMAVIERKDFELKLELVNVHEIIEKALTNITVQVFNKGGIVSKELKALKQTVRADQMHLTNIVYNLLDNANKYSTRKPVIKVTTIDSAKGIVIKIIDQGIGMSKDVANRIFEKFYRNPTGNLHDVKGFGLGLSYVKNMVEAHGGDIKVSSELQKGSVFTLFLPFENG